MIVERKRAIKPRERVVLMKGNSSIEIKLIDISGANKTRDGDFEIEINGQRKPLHLSYKDPPYHLTDGVKIKIRKCCGKRVDLGFFGVGEYQLQHYKTG